VCKHPPNLQLPTNTFRTHYAPQKDEFLRLAINAIHNDLISRNEAFQSLALTFVSNSEWLPRQLRSLRETSAVAVTQIW